MPPTKKPAEKIEIHDHDVLNGRGVNIAQHPGNLRFRALVKSHADNSYCTDYSTSAKKAVAEEIISHIRNLNPPGRFLKRPSRVKKGGCGNGQWEELPYKETLKKACQALRDCNRGDRAEYARHIDDPLDVRASKESRVQSGLSNREYAERIAAFNASCSPAVHSTTAVPSAVTSARPLSHPGQLFVDTSMQHGHSTATESQREHSMTFASKYPATTPATAASSCGGRFSYPDGDDSESFDGGHSTGDHHGVSDAHLPFGDHYSNSPTQAAVLEYDFNLLDEEQKLAAMARESTQFDDLEHDHRESLDAHLDEGADLTAVFDGDHLII